MIVEQIAIFLEKYRHITPPDSAVKKEVQSVVEDVVGVVLNTKDISYVRGVIHLQVSPAARQVIHIKKQAILKKLTQRLEKKTPKDIR